MDRVGLYSPDYEHESCGIGFIARIDGSASHAVIEDSLTALAGLSHRGASGCEENTGDGAGILLQISHGFFKEVAGAQRLQIPSPREYGVGTVFLPSHSGSRIQCKKNFDEIVNVEGQRLIGWRPVPVDPSEIGPTAKAAQPCIEQVFVGAGPSVHDQSEFERKLYIIRRRAEASMKDVYFCSLSSRTVVYKGMLTANQLRSFYPDLSHPAMESALALFHSRFSTNTFPSWHRAHPYRTMVHNGEINTLKGNVNWMKARQSHFDSNLFGDDLEKVLPVIDETGSDSSMFDNCLEFLILAGRPIEEALMMMIPQPWSKHESMDPKLRAFYEFHHSIMEPWDGPSAVAFTDGDKIGAVLDRNGLRPARYWVTHDGRIILTSEVGVLNLAPSEIAHKGRIHPGHMVLVDTRQKRIIQDDEIKNTAANRRPYEAWLQNHLISVDDLPEANPPRQLTSVELNKLHKVFAYSREDISSILVPMARDGLEPVGSMGADTPLAVLSPKPQLLYNYFKQLFAQVTNPPIDPIREEIMMAWDIRIGPERNLLDSSAGSCHQVELDGPILTNQQLARLLAIKRKTGFKSVKIPIFFRGKLKDGKSLERGLSKMFSRAERAIKKGANILILTDRGVNKRRVPIPALLAVSGLHHHLIRHGKRVQVGIILESAEPREVHHFATLVSFGISAINPYLALESLSDAVIEDLAKSQSNYVKAIVKGLVKTISKMGISTVRSYCGAQIFEAVGISDEVIHKYFTWTPSRIGGIGLAQIQREARKRHKRAFPKTPRVDADSPGRYRFRDEGERHLFDPESIFRLQLACRNGDYSEFKKFSNLINNQAEVPCTLRGLLDFKRECPPVSLDEIEPIEAIIRRFKTGAMSYGSISQEAHEALAIAMNRIGGKSNSGEGGEHPSRFKPGTNGDSRNSAIKQVASGRFGVTSEYLVNAKEIQIKIAQGAKPGEGGQLPGHKVYPWIAEVRHSTPGVGLISPPPHHDIYSIEDLAQLIFDLKNANHRARISVKLVAAAGIGTIAAGVAKARADVILISGYDGGTGASPLGSIQHAGVPWELGLSETHQTLLMNDLRSRVTLEVDGQMKTGRDVVVAAILGAEEFGFGTAALVALGCVMMRVCHKNSCEAGIATQDPELRKNFKGSPEHVENFMRFVAQETREIMASLGVRRLDELIGQTQFLAPRAWTEAHPSRWKGASVDFSQILFKPDVPRDRSSVCSMRQEHRIEQTLDARILIPRSYAALEKGEPVAFRWPIKNTDRATGTMLGSEITRRHGSKGLPENTVEILFYGCAGQSFGAFIPPGLTLHLIGETNDYLGKGISGGKIVIAAPPDAGYDVEKSIAVGNVALYGATSGKVFIRGMAGERFCVRNSGAIAVVEGVGDHACEYMTGGRVVMLGPTGRNFAAGMSGGIAYVFDPGERLKANCNLGMVAIGKLTQPDEFTTLRALITEHLLHTESTIANLILGDWEQTSPHFVRVAPIPGVA